MGSVVVFSPFIVKSFALVQIKICIQAEDNEHSQSMIFFFF